VRNAKQVADLCEQLTRMSDLTSVAEVAAQARDAVLRSVVAGYSSVTPRLISPLASLFHARLRRREFTDAESPSCAATSPT